MTESEHKYIGLIHKYKLTKKEVEIIGFLLEGNAVKDISTHLSISINTVRYHLKNMFYKTETHSQQELILLFLHN
jgi:DNA-binding NarL/FixJ family response regulator